MLDQLQFPTSLAMRGLVYLMPPAIEWGGPVQRAKGETDSFWHIPIRIHPGRRWSVWPRDVVGPATVHACEVWLENFDGSVPGSFQLCWGDATLGEPHLIETLRRYHTALVPIAARSEREAGGHAYWADQRFLLKGERALAIKGNRLKHHFRLRVKSGSYERVSPFYLLRVPLLGSNGHFSVEKIYNPIDEEEALRQGRLTEAATLHEDDLRELADGLMALSVRIDTSRLHGAQPCWELNLSVYNASKADVDVSEIKGCLGRPRRGERARLGSAVAIPRGKIRTVTVLQDIDPEAVPSREEQHYGLSLSDLKVMMSLTTAPGNVFSLALPSDIQFDTKNRWSVGDETFVRFHKDRLDSWE